MNLVRPMLASPTKAKDLQTLRFPLLGSTKIDGIRALCVRDGNGIPRLVSRTLKLIPNKQTQERFAREEYVGLDGELVVGEPYDKNLMQQTTSGVMSADGEPNAKWFVFDSWDMPGIPYYLRALRTKDFVAFEADPALVWVAHHRIGSLDELWKLEEQWVNEGYEGMMLRDPNGPYKQNRSTLREGYLLKVKRFEDSEAEVLDSYELNTNNNEQTTDERGYAKRSTHIAGKVGAGMLGGLVVRDTKTMVQFELGTGFTKEQRINLWEGRKYLVGKLITYKHFAVGVKDKPRFPVFKSFRDRRDV